MNETEGSFQIIIKSLMLLMSDTLVLETITEDRVVLLQNTAN